MTWWALDRREWEERNEETGTRKQSQPLCGGLGEDMDHVKHFLICSQNVWSRRSFRVTRLHNSAF